MAYAERGVDEQAAQSAGSAAQGAEELTASAAGLVGGALAGRVAERSSASSAGLVSGPDAARPSAGVVAVSGKIAPKEGKTNGVAAEPAVALPATAGKGVEKTSALREEILPRAPKGAAGAASRAVRRVAADKAKAAALGAPAAIASAGFAAGASASAASADEVSAQSLDGIEGAAARLERPGRKAAKWSARKGWEGATKGWKALTGPGRQGAGSASRTSRAVKASVAKGRTAAGTAKAAARAVASAGRRVAAAAAAAIASAAGPVLCCTLAAVLAFGIVAGVAGGASSPSDGVGSLEGTEAELAQMLKGYGLSNVCVAAIMGNMYAESGYDSHSTDGTGLGDSIGILQFTDEEKAAYLSWCSKNGKTWDDYAPQLEWAFSNESGTGTGYWRNRWMTGLMGRGYYIGHCSVPESYRDKNVTADQFEVAGDVALATYAWMAGYERPSAGLSHYDVRRDKAQEIYAALCSGGTATYLGSGTAAKAASLALAKKGCTYIWGAEGPSTFDCSGLVTWAYRQVGVELGHYTMNQYAQTARVTKKDLQPGDLVFYGSSTSDITHVTIYIGKGKIVGANGGGSCCTLASNSTGSVSVKAYDYRSDVVAFGRVKG